MPINAHPKGIKPPGAMRDQISYTNTSLDKFSEHGADSKDRLNCMAPRPQRFPFSKSPVYVLPFG